MDSRELRQRAELVLTRGSSDGRALPSEVRDLIRELQIHQIEVEMQNGELRDAQLALEDSRQKYFELYDLAPIGYLSLTADSRITDVNRAAAGLLGMERQALLGERFSRLIAPAFTEVFAHHCRAVLASDTPQTCQIELRAADGGRCEVRLESVSAAPGVVYAFRVALIDVTERNRLERELRDKQKLEMVGSLASGVAHEFNNRLMAIVGFAESARGAVEPSSEAAAMIEQLREAALRGRDVTNRLLAFARHEEEGEPADLDRALTACMPTLRQILGDRIRLEVDLAAQAACVELGAAMIEQLLLTLAANARDATATLGTLRITTKRITGPAKSEHQAGEAAEHVVLTCADDGSGMDGATRARAFEPFFTTKPVGVGVGLGLALVNSMVLRANGRIELSSQIGVGTQFQIHLPLAIRSAPSAPPAIFADAEGAETADAVLRGARILVVEDEPLVRATLVHYLGSLRCEVFEADSYDAAVAQLRTHGRSLRLVVSDVVLGHDPRGLELVAAVRRHAPGMRVVFVSAHPTQALLRNKWIASGSRVLQKPFTIEQLKQVVLRALA